MPLAVVTGACGFQGANLVKELVKKGYEVKAIDLPGARWSKLEGLENVEFIKADLMDRESIKGVFEGVDYIFHPAAVFHYGAPREMIIQVNETITKNVFEEAIKSQPKAVLVWSSEVVYGYWNHRPDCFPIKEDHPLPGDPNNPDPKHEENIKRFPYVASKVETEKTARRYYEEHGLPIIILRPAAVYGPGTYAYGKSYSITKIADVVAHGAYGIQLLPLIKVLRGWLPFLKEPIEYKALVHWKDVVGAAIHLAEHKDKAVGEAFNINDDTHWTVQEMIAFIIRAVTGIEIKYFHPIPDSLLKVLLKMAYVLDFFPRAFGGWPHMLAYEELSLTMYSLVFDNSKLKATGYKLRCPDTRLGILETFEYVGALSRWGMMKLQELREKYKIKEEGE